MSRARQPLPPAAPPAAPWRALSALLALLVLGVHLLAYAPAVHSWLHACPGSAESHASAGGKAAPAPDQAAYDTCAIALLAQGVTAAPTALVLSAPCLFTTPCALGATAVAPSSSTAHRLPPAQAPPAAA